MAIVTLGISPGSRTTAFVIMSDTNIVDMQVRDTKKRDCRRMSLRTWLEIAIEKYQVQAISMKVVPSYQSTEVLSDLYSEIRQLANNTGIFLSMYEMETLRKRSAGCPKNAQTLFRNLALEFPELEIPYHKANRNRNRKMFEAVACALAE